MWKVPLFKIYSDLLDVEYCNRVLKRDTFWSTSLESEEFEQNIAKYLGTKYAVVFNSGTSALHAILIALNVKVGSKVAVPSFTFISTANSALFIDAIPRFVDIEEKTLGMDPNQLKKILNREKIGAVIPVHYSGNPCQIDEIVKISRKNKVKVIEDAAESLGSYHNKKMIGTFGDAAILSFAPNKIITTGEGGAVITDSLKIYKKLLLVRSHGRFDVGSYFSSIEKPDYVDLGYNFRMSNISAALGIAQLKKIRKIIKMRRDIAKRYNEKFSEINEIETPIVDKRSLHVYQMYPIRIKNRKRDQLVRILKKSGIMSKIYFEPVHLTKFYRKKFGFKGGELPITEKVSKEVLSLPIYPHMSKKELNLVISEVRKFFGK